MLRLNDIVAVPVGIDEVWCGIVQSIRFAGSSLSACPFSAPLAWDVFVQVNDAWYTLGDIMLIDPRTYALIQAVSTDTRLAG